MAKKKGNKAEAARRGTRADPARAEELRVQEEEREQKAAAIAAVEASGRPRWYVEPLDPDNLSDREKVNHALFIIVELLLAIVAIIDLVQIGTALDGFTTEVLQSFFLDNPSDFIEVLQACVQLISAGIVLSCYNHYVEGDVAYAAYNLVVVLCIEVVLLSTVGIIGLAVLVYRVQKRCQVGLSDWQIYSDFKQKVLDLALSLVVFVIALFLYYLESVL